MNGGGERKDPASSFFMNCKGKHVFRLAHLLFAYVWIILKWLVCAGDACTGDVVLFEQNVYDM